MTTTSVLIEAGQPAPPPPDPKCVALKNSNKAERKKFVDSMEAKKQSQGGELSDADQKALDKAKGNGMTFSSAQTSFGGSSSSMTQASSGLANSQITAPGPASSSEQMMGLNAEKRATGPDKHAEEKEKAGVLCGGSYVHPGGGKGAHAEAKIANKLTNTHGKGGLAGGSMLLNIDWRSNKFGGIKSGMPCEDCHKMLCAASSPPCNIKIEICDHKQQPQQLTQEDCTAPDGYVKLTEKIDGNSLPGRD